jgi:serine/threonine protein kinase
MLDSSIHNNRIKASDLARRSSDDFCEAYGDSALDSIAPFERDEIILGRPVGSGAFSTVYEIQDFNLRTDQSKIYTEEQIKKREATAASLKINHDVKYVMKCLKDEVEVKKSGDEDFFFDAAQDIVHEAEMLAVLSHPNIIKLHGIIASRHDAFLDSASAFFIILERLESTLADRTEGWKKQNSFNPSRSLRSLSSSLSSSIVGDKVVNKARSEADEGGSLDYRLRVATSLAGAVEYLHSQGVIFHDIKPENVGLDKQGNVKLFDFGLARFMPQGDAYEEVFEMSGAGTARYEAPEVFFNDPYNLKADVYSFSVVLWEMMCLQKPFAKCKLRKECQQALTKSLVINRRWPLQIQDIIKSGLSRDLSARPTMSEVHDALNEFVSNSNGVEDCDEESTSTSSPARKSTVFPARLSSNRVLRKFGSSFSSGSAMSAASIQKDYRRNHSDITGTSADVEDVLNEVGEMEDEEKPREQ